MQTKEKMMEFQKEFNLFFEEEVKKNVTEQLKFNQNVTQLDPLLLDIVLNYSRGGKRIRPLIIKLFADEGADRKKVLTAGLASELFHLAALIHDDIMDDSDFRRGAETIHVAAQKCSKENKTLGKDIALLMGDVFLTASMSKAVELGQPFFEEFRKMIQRTIRGQYLDSFAMNEQLGNVLEGELLSRYKLKTAWYTFISPALFGVMLNPFHKEEDTPIIVSVMRELGLLFQIRDDIIDCIDQNSGKPLFTDVFENQTTWVTLYLKKTNPKKFQELVKAKKIKDVVHLKSIFDEIDLLSLYKEEYAKRLILINSLGQQHKSIKSIASNILQLMELT